MSTTLLYRSFQKQYNNKWIIAKVIAVLKMVSNNIHDPLYSFFLIIIFVIPLSLHLFPI
jgi:hypothetical protein